MARRKFKDNSAGPITEIYLRKIDGESAVILRCPHCNFRGFTIIPDIKTRIEGSRKCPRCSKKFFQAIQPKEHYLQNNDPHTALILDEMSEQFERHRKGAKA